MSWAFITAIKQNPHQSYVELLNSVRDVLQSKYTQKPQLSCSHPLGEQVVIHHHKSAANLIRHQPSICYVVQLVAR
jgi:hypothetical protein